MKNKKSSPYAILTRAGLEKRQELRQKALDQIDEVLDVLINDNDDDEVLNVFVCRLAFCLWLNDTKELPFHGRIDRIIDWFGDNEKTFSKYLQMEFKDMRDFEAFKIFEKDVKFPSINKDCMEQIIKCRRSMDWSELDGMFLSYVYENTLNPTDRRKRGAHFTDEKIIHMTIDPLFYQDLLNEYGDVCKIDDPEEKVEAAKALQEKIGKMEFLDPACGGGNFLIEIYASLRELENQLIKIIKDYKGELKQ